MNALRHLPTLLALLLVVAFSSACSDDLADLEPELEHFSDVRCLKVDDRTNCFATPSSSEGIELLAVPECVLDAAVAAGELNELGAGLASDSCAMGNRLNIIGKSRCFWSVRNERSVCVNVSDGWATQATAACDLGTSDDSYPATAGPWDTVECFYSFGEPFCMGKAGEGMHRLYDSYVLDAHDIAPAPACDPSAYELEETMRVLDEVF